MPLHLLTHPEVLAATAREKRYRLSDGGGLLVDVKSNGNKAFLLDYRHPVTKKRQSIAIGKFPDMSLKDAREKAQEYRNQVERGIDPLEYREAKKLEHRQTQAKKEAEQTRQALTLRVVAQNWLHVKASKVSSDFLTDIERSLEIHVFPKFGSIPIDEIVAPFVIEALRPLEAAGKLETVKRITGRLNEIMTYATNTGLTHHNPLSGIREAFQRPQTKNLPSIDPAEVPDLLAAIHNASIRISTRNLILFSLHVALRPSEVAGAQWAEIDTKARLWRLPATRMKKKRAHSVPLTDATLAILQRQHKISGHLVYIFPGDRDDSRPTHAQAANMALKRMGYKDLLVAHGFRCVFRTKPDTDSIGKRPPVPRQAGH